MTCEDLAAVFSEYLDRELPPANCEQIEEHAATCARCSEFLSSIRRTVSLCRDLKAGKSPSPLAPEARERLRELYQRSLAARANS